MTSDIIYHRGNTTYRYCDTLLSTWPELEPQGHITKVVPLPHVNAVFETTAWNGLSARLTESVLHTFPVYEFSELLEKMKHQFRACVHEFIPIAESNGFEFDFADNGEPDVLIGFDRPGETWVIVASFDYEPMRLPKQRVWVDPSVHGSTSIEGGHIPDDEAAVDLMRKARAENPNIKVGGSCIRSAVSPEGIDIRIVGNVDFEPTGAYRRIIDPNNAPRHEAAAAATARPQRGRAKPGRNDPCPCGSGRKAKRCCGA